MGQDPRGRQPWPDGCGTAVADRFWAAATVAARLGLSGPDRVGARMAWAAAATLGGWGAEVALVDGPLTVPWGASDRRAAVAERMQFTTGEGPTFLARAGGQVVAAGPSTLARWWPGLVAQLRQTPFRSVLAIPLGQLAVLTVYFRTDSGAHRTDLDLAGLIGHLVYSSLLTDPQVMGIQNTDPWPTAAGRRRLQVSVAVGMVAIRAGVTTADALAVLRAGAFAQGRMVDDIADEVVRAGATDPGDCPSH